MHVLETFARQMDLQADAYHARPEWSCSQLKLLPAQPELFHGRHVVKPPLYPRDPSAAMDFGTILHGCALEGHDLARYVIPRDVLNADGHRKGKPWLEWKAAHEGQPMLTAADAQPITAMLESLRGEPQARKLLEVEGQVETSLFWHDAPTGLPLRARLDKLADFPEMLVVVDLKTTRDPSPRAFSKAVAEYGYHRQAAMYTDAVCGPDEAPVFAAPFVLIAVGTEPPYTTHVYELSREAIQRGRDENRVALDDLARRLAADDWHGPQHGEVEMLDLPKWAYLTEI